MWNWERITYTDGTHDDFVAIIGSRGADGATGRSGQIVYPAGVYYQDRTYTATTEKAPYVLDTNDGNYYVMNYIGTWVPNEQNGYTPAQSYAKNGTKYWTLLEAFDAIYANVGVIANGLIGAAVFNGNYMFSQYGEGNYEDFPTGTSNPYNEPNGFKPAWCVNLLTGEMWLGKGASYFGNNGQGNNKFTKNGLVYSFGPEDLGGFNVKTEGGLDLFSIIGTYISQYDYNVAAKFRARRNNKHDSFVTISPKNEYQIDLFDGSWEDIGNGKYYQMLISAKNGIIFKYGNDPQVMQTFKGLTTDVTIGDKTLCFKNGILYKII